MGDVWPPCEGSCIHSPFHHLWSPSVWGWGSHQGPSTCLPRVPSAAQPSPPCSICPHQARGDQPAPFFCLISVPCPGNLISSLPGLMLPAGTQNAGLRPCPPSGGLQSPGRVDRCTRAWSRAGHVEAWAVLQWGAHRVSLPQPGSPFPSQGPQLPLPLVQGKTEGLLF